MACIHPANIASRKVVQKAGFIVDPDKATGTSVFPQLGTEQVTTVRYILDLDDAN
jgi:RimJ/RimL family protein N-acetyltransferase